MSRAADLVRSLVSGFPRARRERRLLMVWQAVIDDSGNEPNQHTYILGGFIAPYERWAEFVAPWQAELDAAPAIGTFKFTQARAFKGPWTDWTDTDRNSRVLRFAQIARDHASYFISAGIRHQHFERLIKTVPVFERSLLHDHPYILLLGRIAGAIAQVYDIAQFDEPVDCIVDEQQGFEQEAFDMWNSWRESLVSKRTGKQMLGQLNYQREQDFLPLQAADLAVGAIRHWEMRSENLPELQKISEVPHMDNNYPGEELRSLGIRMLDRIGEISTANPALPLQEFNSKTAARTRKKNRDNKRRRNDP